MLNVVMLSVFMPNVVMLSVFMESVIILSVVTLSVFMLSVFMLSVLVVSVIMLSAVMLSVVMLCVVAPSTLPTKKCRLRNSLFTIVNVIKPFFSVSNGKNKLERFYLTQNKKHGQTL